MSPIPDEPAGHTPGTEQGWSRQPSENESSNDADQRESLVNDRPIGPAAAIQIPTEMITTLHGIMIDIDPHLLRADALPDGATASPEALYELALRPWLARHSTFSQAEVRSSGRGLHVLLQIDPPVTFAHHGDRDRWAAAVKIVQSVLPSDPHAPGITALTRPIGSINTKTSRRVEVLKPGTSVTPDDVLHLVTEIQSEPFRVVARMLVGDRTAPCPVCQTPGARLGIQARAGLCYDGCGKVKIGQLLGAFMHHTPKK